MKNKYISKHHEQAAVEIRMSELTRISQNKNLPPAIRKNAAQLFKYWYNVHALFHIKKENKHVPLL